MASQNQRAARMALRKNTSKMNLSFSGCGFMGVYHVGACTAIRQHAPWLYQGKPIAGSSAGALIAACLITEVPMEVCLSYAALLATKARDHVLGPLNPSFNIVRYLREGLDVVLPDNAHEICTNRLHISLTRVWDRKNVLVSEFRSKQDLLQALLCSAFIPFYCGMIPPEFRGERYMDGSLSDNLPILNDETITVAPFAGECDICPDDKNETDLHVVLVNTSLQCSVHNLMRLSRALFPPNSDSIERICRRGFDDALRYLYRNQMISCRTHSAQHMAADTIPLAGSSSQAAIPADGTDEKTGDTSEETGLEFTVKEEAMRDQKEKHPSDNMSNGVVGSAEKNSFSDWRCMAESAEVKMNPNCAECRLRMQLALREQMPQRVLDVLYCTTLEQNLRLEFLRHGYPSLFQLVTMPYVVPLEYSVVISKYVVRALIEVNRDLRIHGAQLLKLIFELMQYLQKQSSVRIHCEFQLLENLQPTSKSHDTMSMRRMRPLGMAYSSPTLGDTVSLSPIAAPTTRRYEIAVDFEAQARPAMSSTSTNT